MLTHGRSLSMTDIQQGISAGCTRDDVYVKVVGRGTFQNSQPLRRFALDCIQRGYQRFVIDIGACSHMDSTFLGILAGIGLRLRRSSRAAGNQDATVRVVNVSDKNLELIRTLGLDRLLVVQTEADNGSPVGVPEGCCLEKLPQTDIDHQTQQLDRDETTNLMIKSHENLIAADSRNKEKFKEVTKYLRQSGEQEKSK